MAILQHDELLVLLEKAKNSTATQAEYKQLIENINSDEHGEVINDIHAFFANEKPVSVTNVIPYNKEYWQSVFEEIRLPAAPRVRSFPPSRGAILRAMKTTWFRYAAAIIIISGIGAYLWNTKQNEKPASPAEASAKVINNDLPPGSDRAILTLSNGETIELNKTASETINDGTLAIKNNNGQLSYTTPQPDKTLNPGSLNASYNTMSTPKGGQYQLTLSDGTKVWLNAASSITYPTRFTNKSREVKITGEAYFDIAKNKGKPFIVTIEGRPSVEVLGTQFNINSYRDEPVMSATLLEGAIKLGSTILRPGQQAQATANNKIQINNNADVEKVMAWKNGEFNFEGANVEQAMRQISRWYDVEIIYEGGVPGITFMGGVSRSASLSTVLRALQKAGVSFTITGKKIVVRNH